MIKETEMPIRIGINNKKKYELLGYKTSVKTMDDSEIIMVKIV